MILSFVYTPVSQVFMLKQVLCEMVDVLCAYLFKVHSSVHPSI